MSWFDRSADELEDLEIRSLEAQDDIDALDGIEEMPERVDRSQWIDTGIRDVTVADLPTPEGVDGPGSFEKVSEAEMRTGLNRLQEMQTQIESGVGASSDYWGQVDQQKGLDYADGYRRVYDAFYGHDAIRLTRDGANYDIINGRHRIWLAKQMGVEALPARVIERR